jgi:hypothetical protein
MDCVFRMGPLVVAILLVSCGDPGSSALDQGCAQVQGESCQPLYSPEFDEIFARTLLGSCGVSGNSCHAVEGAKAGLVFANADDSHASLLGESGGAALVVPGDAACSELVVRLEAPDPSRSMPPGRPLSEGERCAIEQWIDGGAAR